MSDSTRKNSTEVLIVGAGPTGLAAACILAKRGVRVRIIDKNTARSDKSKALGVQAGTLECLDSLLDPRLSREMVATGHPTSEAISEVKVARREIKRCAKP